MSQVGSWSGEELKSIEEEEIKEMSLHGCGWSLMRSLGRWQGLRVKGEDGDSCQSVQKVCRPRKL